MVDCGERAFALSAILALRLQRFDLGASNRERRTQLVGRLRRETPFTRERFVEARDQLVKPASQELEFGESTSRSNLLARARFDGCNSCSERRERSKGPPRDG